MENVRRILEQYCNSAIQFFRSYSGLYTVVFFAMAFLLIGQVNPHPKMTFGGIPFNTIFCVGGFLFCIFNSDCRRWGVRFLKMTWPLHIAIPFLIVSMDPAYGLFKYGNLLVISLLSSCLLASQIERYGRKPVMKCCMHFLLAQALLALLYKGIFGFWSQLVLYVYNGPIVFGWLMAVGGILCVLVAGRSKIPLLFLFTFCVWWSFSKGPIIGYVGILSLLGILLRKPVVIVAIVQIALLMLSGDIFCKNGVSQDASRISVNSLVNCSQEPDGAVARSVSIRRQIYTQSYELLKKHPGGIGLGSWPFYLHFEGVKYPHNLFLEAMCEMGVIGGLIFLIPFLYFIFSWRISPEIFYPALFFLFALQLSGDLADARYLLVFSLMARIPTKTG